MGLQKAAFTFIDNFGYFDILHHLFRQWILLIGNLVHEETVVIEGKVEVAKLVNINCVINHRYLYLGGKGRSLFRIF